MAHKLSALALAAAIASGVSAAQPRHSTAANLSALVGRWQIDPAQTRMGRNGPAGDNILRSTTFTFVFSPRGEGLTMDVYADYPLPRPTRSMSVVADAVVRICPDPTSCMTRGGVAAEQSYSWTQLSPTLFARLFYIKGKPYDYSTVSVASDRKTMTLMSWDPATPQYQNIQVFVRR